MTIEPGSPAPASPEPEQPQPFSDQPQDPPGGCGRPLLVGCSVAIVLAGLLLLGVLWKARDLMPALLGWSLAQFEEQISGNLPADLEEAERRRLSEAFEAAIAAVEEGSFDPAALQQLQSELLKVARGGGSLRREDVLDLIEALEGVAGESPLPPPAADPGRDEDPMPVAVHPGYPPALA